MLLFWDLLCWRLLLLLWFFIIYPLTEVQNDREFLKKLVSIDDQIGKWAETYTAGNTTWSTNIVIKKMEHMFVMIPQVKIIFW